MTDRLLAENNRNHGIDLLRIISMLMVVMLHVLGHGGVLNAADPHTARYWVIWFIEFAAFCAVNCYAMISGYVGVFSKYRFSNLVLLWCRVEFYSIIITLIFYCLYPGTVKTSALLFSFFPIVTEQYWYFTSYAIMFLFIPILNIALERLPKKTISVLILLILFITTLVFPICTRFSSDWIPMRDGASPWWLMILYLVGGYIRKYGLLKKVKTYLLIVFYFTSVLLSLFLKHIIQTISSALFGKFQFEGILTSYTWITIFLSALFLFLVFERIKSQGVWTSIISFLSPLAFSVYLIHEHIQIKSRLIMDHFTWLLNLPIYLTIPVLFAIVIGIYLLCSSIDLFRHYMFKWIRLKERLLSIENKIRTRFMCS